MSVTEMNVVLNNMVAQYTRIRGVEDREDERVALARMIAYVAHKLHEERCYGCR